MIPATLYQTHRFFISPTTSLSAPLALSPSFVLLLYRPTCSFDSCSEIHIITSGHANLFLFNVSSTGTLP
jgi:hypothetical protein